MTDLEALDGAECPCCAGTVTFDGTCGDCGCPHPDADPRTHDPECDLGCYCSCEEGADGG